PTLAYIRKEAEKARTTPSYFPTFARLHLNRRIRAQRKLIDLGRWDALGGIVDLGRLRWCKAWGGLDLSAISDFSSCAWSSSPAPRASRSKCSGGTGCRASGSRPSSGI